MIEERMFAHGLAKVITRWDKRKFDDLRIFIIRNIGEAWPELPTLRISDREQAYDLMKVLERAKAMEEIMNNANIRPASQGSDR